MAYEGHIARGSTGHLMRWAGSGHLRIAVPSYSIGNAVRYQAYGHSFRSVNYPTATWAQIYGYNVGDMANALAALANGNPPSEFRDPGGGIWAHPLCNNVGGVIYFSDYGAGYPFAGYSFGYTSISGVKILVSEANNIWGSPVLSSLSVSTTGGSASYFRIDIGTSATDPGGVMSFPSNLYSGTGNTTLTNVGISQYITIRLMITATPGSGSPPPAYTCDGTYSLGTVTEAP